ncbi:MAG: beta-propeller fold lactonase family protein, partial [Burkholderiales bacterium]
MKCPSLNCRSLFLAFLLTACGGGGDGGGGGGASTFTIGGTVSGLSGTVVLQNNGGGDLTVSVNAGFTFATALANGGTYNVTVLTQPADQTCTVTNGSGTISGSNVTNVSVACVSLPRFSYVANFSDNTVSIYTVDAATGQLRARGYVIAGTNPSSVTVDPSGKFAYVANFTSNNISAFSINAATGALT